MKKAVGMASVCVSMVLATGLRAQDWPQWRGPSRDNKVTGFTEPKTWPKDLTKKWTVKVGPGESSPVLAGDKLYAFTRDGGEEVIVCLDAKTGNEIWKEKYATAAVSGPASKYPGPRSTPAVGEGKLCALGVNGVLSCLDAASGKVVWRKETNKGTKPNPQFYTSTSPLIADGKCFVYTSGLTAYDLANGDVKWEWKGGAAPYGSPVVMTADGVKQIVSPSDKTLAGIDMKDGKLLWEHKLPGAGYQINYSTPVISGQTVLYSVVPKGPGANILALKIEKKGDAFSATEIDSWKKGLAADKYQTPVLVDGLLFGLSTAGKIFCMDAKTGEEKWQDQTKHGECGAVLNAGSVLLSLSSDKSLIAFKPSPEKYLEVAKYTVGDAATWATPIVSGNRVYIRDNKGALTLYTIE